MKEYTYKTQKIVQEYEWWTGHIDSYFNKRFIFRRINSLIVPVSDEIASIIDECNDLNYYVLNSIKKELSANIIEECIKLPEYVKPLNGKNEMMGELTLEEAYNIKRLMSILKKTYNTLFEFVDENGGRRCIYIFDCELRLLNKENDSEYYEKALVETNGYNKQVEKEIIDYLNSINAYEDFLEYHRGQSEKWRLISEGVNKAIKTFKQ